jgi:hypothetical protein
MIQLETLSVVVNVAPKEVAVGVESWEEKLAVVKRDEIAEVVEVMVVREMGGRDEVRQEWIQGVTRREPEEAELIELRESQKAHFEVVRWVETYLFILLHGEGIWRR